MRTIGASVYTVGVLVGTIRASVYTVGVAVRTIRASVYTIGVTVRTIFRYTLLEYQCVLME